MMRYTVIGFVIGIIVLMAFCPSSVQAIKPVLGLVVWALVVRVAAILVRWCQW